MGKIRVKTLGDETFEREEALEAKKRRQAKQLKKGKAHVKGVGLKGGQLVKVMEGVELAPEIKAVVDEMDQGVAPAVGEPEKKAKPKKIKLRMRSKRYKQLLTQVDKRQLYKINDAIKLLKKTSNTRFDATVEVHVNLNRATLPKDKPSLSGSVNLPHGTGKKRIIKIADDAVIDAVAKGKIDFDILVAHPSMMPKLAKHARVLGPKGLMPNPKNSTVTPDPEKRAKELEGGEITWKTEADHPVIHQVIGKASFVESQIEENLTSLIKSIGAGKIAKLTLSSTMGPGIRVDTASIT